MLNQWLFIFLTDQASSDPHNDIPPNYYDLYPHRDVSPPSAYIPPPYNTPTVTPLRNTPTITTTRHPPVSAVVTQTSPSRSHLLPVSRRYNVNQVSKSNLHTKLIVM